MCVYQVTALLTTVSLALSQRLVHLRQFKCLMNLINPQQRGQRLCFFIYLLFKCFYFWYCEALQAKTVSSALSQRFLKGPIAHSVGTLHDVVAEATSEAPSSSFVERKQYELNRWCMRIDFL